MPFSSDYCCQSQKIVKIYEHNGEGRVQSGFGIFLFDVFSNKTGRRIRLVIVATNKVTEVSHPSAKVPPKLLKQKMTKPAINTNDVYTMLRPVCLMVAFTVASTL